MTNDEVDLTEEEVLEVAMNEFANFVEENEDFDSLEEALDAFCEQEQLDELGRATLVSYLKKSPLSAALHAMKFQDKGDKKSLAKTTNRIQGIKRVASRLTKESFEPLLQALANEKPHEFTQTFNDLIKDRVADAIEQRKLELASDLFGAPEGLEESETFEAQDESFNLVSDEQLLQLLDEGRVMAMTDEHGETWHHAHMYRNKSHPDYRESRKKDGTHDWSSDGRNGHHVWINHKNGNVVEHGMNGGVFMGGNTTENHGSGIGLDTRHLYHVDHYNHKSRADVEEGK